jgi:D-arabinose 1-dehydrogenase-like Zn-dependent alcohol dehydrogenase
MHEYDTGAEIFRRAMGMRPIVIDSGEQKKKLCLELGADEFIDFKEHSDVAARVKEVAGGVGAHGVLVTAYQAYKGKQEPSTGHLVAASLTNDGQTQFHTWETG